MKSANYLFLVAVLTACRSEAQDHLYAKKADGYELTLKGAEHLASLPLKCLDKAYPYKTGIVFLDSSFIVPPSNYHPAFFGCYDWHSSVHGHWMLVRLLKAYPNMNGAAQIRQRLREHLSAKNILKELAIFKADNASFERPYGWAWFLRLQTELLLWNDELAKDLSKNLYPLAQHFSKAWLSFLNRIVYPIRAGEHTNLAYGLSFTWDYAVAFADDSLKIKIREVAKRFYQNDRVCPITWEPGGYDFLSPCLEETRLMSRIMEKHEFESWMEKFLPGFFKNPGQHLRIALVKDRSDGKLVHLDGLNLSRAACLYEIAGKLSAGKGSQLRRLAAEHLQAALPHVVSGSYAGEHWLASFAVYALLGN